MSVTTSAKIGEGIFTIPEVARILDLPTSKVGYWLKEYWQNRFSKHTKKNYSWNGASKAVNFYTLIEFYVYYQLRAFGVKSVNIQKAHKSVAKYLKTDYPFAHGKLLTDGKSVLFENKVADIINADDSLQLNMKEIISPFCNRIKFGKDQLPTLFFPSGKSSDVVIDPRHQFGVPTIKGTNIPTETIYRLFRGGETVSIIAQLYDLKVKSVRDVIKYHNAA